MAGLLIDTMFDFSGYCVYRLKKTSHPVTFVNRKGGQAVCRKLRFVERFL